MISRWFFHPGVQPVTEGIVVFVAIYLLMNIADVGTKFGRGAWDSRMLMTGQAAAFCEQRLAAFCIGFVASFRLQQIDGF